MLSAGRAWSLIARIRPLRTRRRTRASADDAPVTAEVVIAPPTPPMPGSAKKKASRARVYVAADHDAATRCIARSIAVLHAAAMMIDQGLSNITSMVSQSEGVEDRGAAAGPLPGAAHPTGP